MTHSNFHYQNIRDEKKHLIIKLQNLQPVRD